MKQYFITSVMLVMAAASQAQDLFGIDKRDGLYYQTKQGSEKLLPYDEIAPFFEYRARVRLKGNYGYINPDAELISPAKYTKAVSFYNGFAQVAIDDKWGIINRDGKEVIPLIYNTLERMDSVFVCQKDKFWGVLNEQNQIVIPFEYVYMRPTDFSLVLAVKNKTKAIIFNTKGEIVFEPEGLTRIMPLSPILFMGLSADNKLCFYAPKGKKIACYDDGFYLEDIFMGVADKGVWGIISTNDGHVIIPFQYEALHRVGQEVFAAKKDGKWAIVNFEGKALTPFKYNTIGDRVRNGKVKATIGDSTYQLTIDN